MRAEMEAKNVKGQPGRLLILQGDVGKQFLIWGFVPPMCSYIKASV